MKHDIFLKKYLTFIFAAVIIINSLVSILPVNGEEAIYSKILRLHVIANSDSSQDQSLKLCVRDAVLAELSSIYSECGVSDLSGAVKAVNSNIRRLEKAASDKIASMGYAYSSEVILTDEEYPAKKYEEFTLPAGVYTSLQVKIGKATGKNWWCVLYPSLCLSAASSSDLAPSAFVYEENGEKFIAAGFTPQEIRIITESDSGEVKIKFRILEIIESVLTHDKSE